MNEPDPDTADVQLQWQRCRAAIAGGVTEEIRAAAARLIALVDVRDDLHPGMRGILYYDAGVGLERVLTRGGNEVAREAHRCQLRSTELLREQVLSGDVELSRTWAAAVRSLALVAAHMTAPVYAADVERAEAELDSARIALAGSDLDAQLASAYASIGSGLVARCRGLDAGAEQSAWLRDKAVAAFETALELDREAERAGDPPLDHDRMVIRVNYCVCLSLGPSTRNRMYRLSTACAQQAAWLVAAGLSDRPLEQDAAAPSALAVLVEALLGAIAAHLRSIDDDEEEGAWRARAFAAPTLYALLPEGRRPGEAKSHLEALHEEPGAERPDPISLLESVEVTGLAILMKRSGGGDAGRAVYGILDLDPPAAPIYVISALASLGHDHAEIVDASRMLGMDEDYLADDVATRWRLERRVGRFIALADSGSRASVSDLREHGEAVFDAVLSGAERLRLIAFLAAAGVAASRAWQVDDVRALRSVLDAWARRLAETGERRPILEVKLAEVELSLLRHGDPMAPDLRRRARRIRTFVEAGGDLEHPALGDPKSEYFDALVNEAWAIVTMRKEDGLDPHCEEVDGLRELAEERLREWDVDDELRAHVAQGLEDLFPSYEIGETAGRFAAAAAGGSEPEAARPAAWRLLRAATIAPPGNDDAETRAAVQRAIATILGEPAALHLAGYVTLAGLLDPRVAARFQIGHPDRLALFELALGDEPPVAALPALAQAALHAADLMDGASPVRQGGERLSERAAELIFSSREAVAALPPDLCARLLVQRALAGLNGGASSLRELAHRTDLAIASLATASVTGSAPVVASALYAVAELVRGLHVYPSAAVLHAALASHVETLADDELPTRVRAAMAEDAAQLPDRPHEHPRGPDVLHNATAALGHVGAGGRLDPRRLWQEIENLTGAVADGQLDERLAAHRLLVALGAVRAVHGAGQEVREGPLVALVRASLAAAVSPRVPNASLALPLLEHCVLGAVLAADFGTARAALTSFRATVNEQVIASDLDSLPSSIETTGAIDEAAVLAVAGGQPELALEIAESGRTKLLMAAACGLLPFERLRLDDGDSPVVAEPIAGLPTAVRELIGSMVSGPTANVVEEWCDAMSTVDWVDVVTDIAVPWWPLIGVRESSSDALPRLGATSLEARRAALSDPGPAEIDDASTDVRRVLWVLGTPDRPTVIGPPWEKSAPEVEPATVLVDCASEPRAALDVAWTVWVAQANGHRAAEGILTGEIESGESVARSPSFPSILPSARFLDLCRKRPAPELDVFVLADPTRDLAGTVLEAAAWADQAGTRTRVEIGGSATSTALFEALRTSRTVVVGCHGSPMLEDGGAALQLADRAISHRDLLNLDGPLATERLVLSCCWGGDRSSRRTRREALGLVSSLLAIGVEEVVAPLDPVDDMAAGLLGCVLASCVAAGCDLRTALGAARIGLRDAKPETPFEAWLDRLGGAASLDLDPVRVTRLTQALAQAKLRLLRAETASYGVFGAPDDSPRPPLT